MIGERLRGVGASLVTAILFIIAFFLFTALIGSIVGEGFKDLNLDDLGTALANFDLMITLLIVFLWLFTGLLVIGFGRYVRPKIAMWLGAGDQESTQGTELEYTKKAVIVTTATIIIVGLVVIMFIGAFNSFLQNINPDVNIIDFGTLVNAISTSDPGFWFWYIVGLLILATIVDVFGRMATRIAGGVSERI